MTLATPTPMLLGSRQRSTLIVYCWVPAKFWDDHSERCPTDNGEKGLCVEEKRAGSRVLIYGSAAQYANLRGDAEFYAQGNVDDCAALVRSAKATVAALDEAGQ